MKYPIRLDYETAIRNPSYAFTKIDPNTKVKLEIDSELAAGEPVERINERGDSELWLVSGGFSTVFKYRTLSPTKLWALKCFTRNPSENLAEQYGKVENCMKDIYSTPVRSYFIDFSFLNEGIMVNGNLYPLLKMEWVQGKILTSFIRDNLSNRSQLESLAQAWQTLCQDLVNFEIAHGDLQHGNVIIDNRMKLKLIDYDSLYYQPLSRDNIKVEDKIKGLLGYQHPLRKSIENQCLQIDFFSQSVIYLSIIALAEKPQLWKDYIGEEEPDRLLFKESDFLNPDESQIFRELAQLSSQTSRISAELKSICLEKDFSQIPSLDAVLKQIKATDIFIERKKLMDRLLRITDRNSHQQKIPLSETKRKYLIPEQATPPTPLPRDKTQASTYGLWATFEAVLSDSRCSFRNPFESDVWLLIIEISNLSYSAHYHTIRIESQYNLYHNLISSVYSSSEIREEAGNKSSSSINFCQYTIWRKNENLVVESGRGNFLRVTGQLIRSEYKSSL